MRVGALAMLVAIVPIVPAESTPAKAAMRTFVDLVRTDESAPRLGRPSIRVVVRGPRVPESTTLAYDLSSDLSRVAHVRPLSEGDRGDFALDVRLLATRHENGVPILPFEARLLEPDGTEVWAVTGRTEVAPEPLDASVLSSVRSNVVSALIRDGWIHAKDDPEHPAPPPPVISRGPR